MLWTVDEFVLCAAVLAAFLAVLEAGYRLGLRRSDTDGHADAGHVSTLQSAVLGLLALLLGFSFAMSVSRYDARKARVLEEANAIGTTALRAQLLPAAQSQAVAPLLKDYVASRIAYHEAGLDAARLAAAEAAAAKLEAALWAQARAAAATDPHAVTTASFISTLNDMLDARERRRAAMDDHVPEAVVVLLLVVSGVALGLVAYGGGLERRRRWRANTILAALIAVVFTAIIDLDRPRRGLIQVGQDSLLRVQAGMAQPQAPIAPVPR